MSVCVAVTRSVRKTSLKVVCAFFLPGADTLNLSRKEPVHLEVYTRAGMREYPHKPLSKVFLDGAGQGGGGQRVSHSSQSKWPPPLSCERPPCPAWAGQLDCRCPGSTGTLLSLYHGFFCKSNIIPSEWQINSSASTYSSSHLFCLFLRWRAGKPSTATTAARRTPAASSAPSAQRTLASEAMTAEVKARLQVLGLWV